MEAIGSDADTPEFQHSQGEEVNDHHERYAAGKTIKKTEYGIRFPDGHIEWNTHHYAREDIRTEKGRHEFLASRAREFQRLHIPPVGEIEFVERVVTTKFSSIIPARFPLSSNSLPGGES